MGRKKISGEELKKSEILGVYRKLLSEDKILIDGPAYKRMKQLALKWA